MNILVTGGASGLGKAITENLAKNKENKIYFTYYRSANAAHGLEKNFVNTTAVKCDFTNPEDLQQLLVLIDKMEIDALVNNAFSGNIEKRHFHKTGIESFEKDFADNIVPVIKITQQSINVFRKKKFGKIITVLSSAIINRPPVGWSHYVAGKSYLHALANSWAVENAAFNITSNCISPSFMQTALTSDTDERIVEEMTTAHPLKKLLSVTEVAEAVGYFITCSQQVNGTNFVINAASDIV